jgi:hypothetical protein
MAENTTPEDRSSAVTAQRGAALLAVVVALGVGASLQRSDAQTPPKAAPAPKTAPAPAPAPASTDTPPSSAAPTPPPAPPADPTIARITFTTMPPVQATVSWGKAKLGRITPQEPLVVKRPRDSGPLDVIVRANGFLPVHTRAHTFADNKLQVKLTRPDQKSTLLGYRAPIEPIDAGVEMLPEDAVSPALPESPEWDMTQPPPADPTPLQPTPLQPAPLQPAPVTPAPPAAAP